MDDLPLDDLLPNQKDKDLVKEVENDEEKRAVLHPTPYQLAGDGWSGLVGDQTPVV